MSYSLNSLKGMIYGTIIGVIKLDTRSLDCRSYTGISRHLRVLNL